MSNLTIKRAGELTRSVFEILWESSEGMMARDVMRQIPRFANLTTEELQPAPNGHIPQYEKIVRIATIPVTQAGWLAKNDKGLWRITPEGYEAGARFSSAQQFYHEALRLYELRRRIVPESVITLELAQESAWAQIKKYLLGLSAYKLHAMLVSLLYAMKYYPAWSPPAGKDSPKVDLIAYTDPLGANGCRLLVQIKQKGQPVTLEGIKSFATVLQPGDFGMILSTAGFTHDALQNLAQIQKITALDAAAFYNLWVRHYQNLEADTRALMPLKAVNFLALPE